MATRTMQLYSGVDSVRAADELRKAIQDRRDAWPYPHVYPPPDAIDVHVVGAVLTQALGGAAVEVIKYQVNSGKRFYLRGVLLSVVGSAFIPGAVTFTVDRNSAIGIANTQFMPEHGLVNVPIQLGSSQTIPWPLQRAREFSPLDVVRIKGTNVSYGVGDPNYYVCGLFGYEVPVLNIRATK